MYRLTIVTHVYMKLWVPDNLVFFLYHSGVYIYIYIYIYTIFKPYIYNIYIQETFGTSWIENGRVKKYLKTLKEDKCTACRSKTGNIHANKWKLQQYSRANKQTKILRYFTIQIVRQ